MLVQKRKTSRKMLLIWGVIIIAVLVAGFLVYENFSSSTATLPSQDKEKPISTLPVPKEFGEALFSDPRFNELTENPENAGMTEYVDQLQVNVTSEDAIAPPSTVRVYNPGYGGRLIVSWDMPEQSITGFDVYRGTAPAGPYQRIATLNADAASYVDANVPNNETMYYRVKALKVVEKSKESNIVAGGSASPSGVSASVVTSGSGVVLSWQKQTGESLRAGIQRTHNGDTATIALIDLVTENSYFDAAGAAGDSYTLITYSDYVESVFSPVAQNEAKDTLAPAAPTDVTTVVSEDGTTVTFYWTNPLDTDFDYVRIYRSDQQGVIGSLLKDGRATTNRRFDSVTGKEGCVAPATKEQEESASDAEGDCFVAKDIFTQGKEYYFVVTSVDRNKNESSRKIIPPFGRPNPFQAY